MRHRPDLLENEFSLDLFQCILAYGAAHLEVPLPEVLPLYVGLVRDPAAGFDAAVELAEWLDSIRDEDTAVVATGDLVHYGHAYCVRHEMDGLPADTDGLTSHFRSRVEDVLSMALEHRDYEAFYRISVNTLKSDQRNVFPVVAELLGRRAEAEILEFTLSDYAGILGVAPPCVVASTLAAFVPAAGGGADDLDTDELEVRSRVGARAG